MPLILDHPLFDALGLGPDTKNVGLPQIKLDRQGHAYHDQAVTEPPEKLWRDMEHPVNKVLTTAAALTAPATPMLLSYHSGDDAELAFIPKTLAGFAIGTIFMGLCMNLSTIIFFNNDAVASFQPTVITQLAQKFVFIIGLAFVAASLLLVGLKVRADHSPVNLHSHHWINSIITGAIFSLLVWGPWLAIERGIHIDRFLLALFWMALFIFPALAAKWTVGPAKGYGT